MSVLAAETQSIHISLKPNPALSSMSFPAELRSPVKSPEIFEQNTLITYVYCFVKSVIGASGTGTNTVAIDNKIQQALDLVKTHLMFALRDEVEVLKEKITELTDRITELEDENTILRAHATQETLAQLCQSKQQQQQQQQQQTPSRLNNINTNNANMNNVINVTNTLNNNNS